MSKIEEMLKRLCPEGVERKPLKEVFDLRNGYTPSKSKKSFWTNGIIPWFRMEDIRENGRLLSDSSLHVTETAVKGELFPANTIIISTSATIGEHALIRVPALANQRFTGLSVKAEYVDRIDIKFAFYMAFHIGAFCRQVTNKGNFLSVDMARLKCYPFPLPPRPVQDEIVKALDAMDAAVKSLEEERTARQEQFEAMRERSMKVLASKQDLLHSLSEICSIKNGGDYKSFGPGPYPVYGSGGVMTHVDHYAYDKPSVLLPRKGSIDRIYYVEKPFWNVDTIYYTMINEGVWPKYFYHYMTTVSMARYNKAGGVPSLTQGDWNRQFVPIPAFAVQKKIAAQLDAFAAVVAALDEEIAARREQFAGWLERLMTFDAREVAVA